MFRSILGRHRDRSLFGVTLALSCLLLALDEGTQADLARRLGASVYAPLQSIVQGVEDLVVLRRENRQLRRVVATLNLERQRLLQFRDEIDELRRVAGFASERFPLLLPCQIVGRSTDRFQNMLQLSCGSGDSLAKDMSVMAYPGLVGRVREVAPGNALVETLASPGMAVSVINQRSGVVGILRWVRGNQFSLDRVDAVEDVLVGDALVTSGLGGVYPRGIPVGMVTRVEVSLDGLFKQVDVRTQVDFAGLQEVFVVRRLVHWDDQAVYEPDERELLQTLSSRTPEPAREGEN